MFHLVHPGWIPSHDFCVSVSVLLHVGALISIHLFWEAPAQLGASYYSVMRSYVFFGCSLHPVQEPINRCHQGPQKADVMTRSRVTMHPLKASTELLLGSSSAQKAQPWMMDIKVTLTALREHKSRVTRLTLQFTSTP